MLIMNRDLRNSTLARFGAVIVGLSFVIFVVGVFPSFFSLDFTSGFGILQIAALLIGLSFMTLGAYVYMYATRHRAQPPRLREDIGLRLMATGIVIAWATGMADVIGIGTHFGQQRPFFGPVQAWGVAVGVMMIVAGIGLYSQKSQS
jgi:hypothetical protein